MSPRTEEFLNFLLWTAEGLMQPTFRNLNGSYEGWCYRHGFVRQAADLRRQQWLEREPGPTDDRLYRLTERGRLHALGGRDPQAQWARPWDGRWRMVLFDVPEARAGHRARLRRYLRESHFGYLQNSVWVTPDSLAPQRETLAGGTVDVESLILLEVAPCAGESDAQIVAGAWDFARVNRAYARHMKVLDERPRARLDNESAARAFRRWAAAERAAWLAAARCDPLLPQCILPADYLGQKAWHRRVNSLAKAADQLRSFRPEVTRRK